DRGGEAAVRSDLRGRGARRRHLGAGVREERQGAALRGPPVSARLVCRADHIGSLMRPRALKEGYKALAAGHVDAAAFSALQDEAVRQAVAMQEAAGLDAVTDGEFRRRSWFAGFVDAVDGLTHKDTAFNFMERGEAAVSVPVPHAEAPIRRTNGIATGELAFLKKITKRTIKVTLPA